MVSGRTNIMVTFADVLFGVVVLLSLFALAVGIPVFVQIIRDGIDRQRKRGSGEERGTGKKT